MTDESTDSLDELLSTPEVVLPSTTPEMRLAFICDIAQETYPPEEIAARYGFPDGREMVKYISKDRSLIAQIKARRAYWNSDVGLQEKLRTVYGHSLLYSGIENAKLMLNPAQKPELRLDMARLHARIAGVDGLPPAGRGSNEGGGGGARFVLQINLPGMESKPLIDATIEGGDNG